MKALRAQAKSIRANPEPSATLEMPVRYLRGVGPERCRVLAKLGLRTLRDLFYFFPRRYEDRTEIKAISDLRGEGKECVCGAVTSRSLIRTKTGQSVFRMVVTDGKNELVASWFRQPYLHKIFLPRQKVVLWGKSEREGRRWKMVHPEYEIVPEGDAPVSPHSGRIVPVYPLTEELNQKGLRQILFNAVREGSRLADDSLGSDRRREWGLVPTRTAFTQLHFPDNERELARARRRLVFDEFLLMQLVVQARKRRLQTENADLTHDGGDECVRRLTASLEFELTAGQRRAVDEILGDMKSTRPMNRLLQGDVGSGKTVVAASALAFAASNGFQGVLMAPTEVLAQQHFIRLSEYLSPLGIACAYLAQGVPDDERGEILRGVRDGSVRVLIGTHALIQPDVSFHKLGLVVIDEQQKFGVYQRAALKEKGGARPHFLLMTATPIPRTLSLSIYGDLDVSTLDELPSGRRPVRTFWVNQSKRPAVYGFLERQLAEGRQAFVVCPLIGESSRAAGKGAVASHAELSRLWENRRIGLLHGRLAAAEKNAIMEDFRAGRLDVLVSTVVIEVGVDVPNATLLIIENAERFGLAQLHQLRGRVGRGEHESYCVLFSESADPESVERLSAFERIHSGFDIAEKDLEIRGAGDVLGARQHGLPELRIGDLVRDRRILEEARARSREILDEDPRLELPKNQGLRRALKRRYGVSGRKPAGVA